MLEHLCENNSYEVLKMTAEDVSALRKTREKVPKTHSRQLKKSIYQLKFLVK